MEDVNIQEASYGKGRLNSRNENHRLLQCLHWAAKSIDGPPDEPGLTQGGWGKEKPQVLQGADHLAHCGAKGGPNLGGRRGLQ